MLGLSGDRGSPGAGGHGEALKVILFFNEFVLKTRLRDLLGSELFDRMEYKERDGLAEHRLNNWLKEKWPEFDPEKEDAPEAFRGTLDCPQCGQDYFLYDYHAYPKKSVLFLLQRLY